jgi:endonuclease/exonuclease/phosphatase family metal-dependent hydrolase
VYGDPHHKKTNIIWQDASTFVLASPDTPTLCMGDLNELMNASEKCGPRNANLFHINDFCCMVKQCGLFDLGFNGLAYTWTDKRTNTNPTYEHLDHCLANAAWCQLFPRTVSYHLPILYSDHAPILTILQGSSQQRKKTLSI